VLAEVIFSFRLKAGIFGSPDKISQNERGEDAFFIISSNGAAIFFIN